MKLTPNTRNLIDRAWSLIQKGKIKECRDMLLNAPAREYDAIVDRYKTDMRQPINKRIYRILNSIEP